MQSLNKAAVSEHISLTNSDVYSKAHFYLLRGNGSGADHVADFEEINQHSAGNGLIHHHLLDTTHLCTISSTYNNGMIFKANNNNNNIVPAASANNLPFGGLTNILGSTEIASSGVVVLCDNLVDSDLVPHHSNNKHTDTHSPGFINKRVIGAVDSMVKIGEQKKAHCRLAQNREAAKKCRMRKKAYVQQLENNRQRLTQLEHELEVTRQQGIFAPSGFSRDHIRQYACGNNGSAAFNVDYEHWLEEHQCLINDLRSSLNSQSGDNELRLVLGRVMSHYEEIFQLKGTFAKSNIFHVLSGMWKTPAERFLLWLGGFRSSDFLKVLGNQIEALTDEQMMGICNLQHSSQQAEDALSQGMEALQQSIVDTISSNSICDHYVEQMANAMSKLATLENFLRQADLLRLQTLQQLQRILTPRQAACALLAINDYKSRLRALSSLWSARPN
ncbi:hypothetical protein ABFS83_05G032000 [Erythranthe nasuta]